MSRKNIIYGLACPYTKEIHYVGKSTQGLIRPLQHMRKSHSDKINEWVTELKKLGNKPELKILEYDLDTDELDSKETEWIIKLHNEGNILLNNDKIPSAMVLPEQYENKEYVMMGDNSSVYEQLKEYIKQKRKKLGLTQPEYARRSGIGLRFLREVEQGSKKTFQLSKIEDALKLIGFKLAVVKIKSENKNPYFEEKKFNEELEKEVEYKIDE